MRMVFICFCLLTMTSCQFLPKFLAEALEGAEELAVIIEAENEIEKKTAEVKANTTTTKKGIAKV